MMKGYLVTVGQGGSFLGGDGEEVGVIAAFFQIHHDVQQRYLDSAAARIERLEIPGQNVFVVLLLHGRELHTNDKFLQQPKDHLLNFKI